MLRYKFYMFILYNEFGKKLKDVLNSLFPGLIREPQPIRVPVRRRDERTARHEKISTVFHRQDLKEQDSIQLKVR